MIVKIDTREAGDILIKYLEKLFPGMLIMATEKYNGFEFDVTEKLQKEGD